jgi:hypothetical protein
MLSSESAKVSGQLREEKILSTNNAKANGDYFSRVSLTTSKSEWASD